jgi:hypothetical protein
MLLYLHSIIRYFILFFALIVAAQSLVGMMGKKQFGKGNKMFALALLIFCDLQLVFGLILYYTFVISSGMLKSGMVMKDPASRFWAVEHSVGMIVAIILVHIGYSVAKKPIENEKKFKRLFWCSFIALCIFVATIPWQYKQVVGRPNIPVMQAN